MIAVKKCHIILLFAALFSNKNEQNNKKVTLYSILKSRLHPKLLFPFPYRVFANLLAALL